MDQEASVSDGFLWHGIAVILWGGPFDGEGAWVFNDAAEYWRWTPDKGSACYTRNVDGRFVCTTYLAPLPDDPDDDEPFTRPYNPGELGW